MEENNYLDKVVKDKLQQLDVEYQAETWALLEQKLGIAEDATQLEDNALDAMTFKALQDYELPYENDWADLSKRLDDDFIDTTILGALETIDVPYEDSHWAMMSNELDNQLIDSTIGAALTDIEIPYQESDWSMMSQRLDEEVLDKTAFDALSNFEVPYNEAHWALMSQRLDAIFARPLEVIQFKLVELVLLLFLFFGAGQFIPAEMPQPKMPIAEHPEKGIIPFSVENDVPENITDVPTLGEGKSLQSKDEFSNTPLTNIIKSSSLNEEKSLKNINKKAGQDIASVSKIPALIIGKSKAGTTNNKNSSSINAGDDIFIKEKITDTDISDNLINKPNTQIDESSSIIEESTISSIKAVAPINYLLKDIPFLNKKREKESDIIAPLHIQAKKKAKVRVGMFAAVNADFIFTPRDPILELDPYDRYAPGYGGGISLGWKHSRWEVETAIAYNAKRYYNIPFIHIYDGGTVDGYQANFLTGIELNMVSIPLHLNYHVVNTGKWRVYGLTGGTMQVVLQANYDANREDLGGEKEGSFSVSGGPKPNPSEEDSNSLFAKKDFNEGFLLDKNLKENSYYSIDVGLGLEHYITPHWNIFVQPMYQHSLPKTNSMDELGPNDTNGLGPNNDKINTLQLLIGVKSNL